MNALLLRIIKAVVRKWLPNYHLRKSPQKGLKRKTKSIGREEL